MSGAADEQGIRNAAWSAWLRSGGPRPVNHAQQAAWAAYYWQFRKAVQAATKAYDGSNPTG